LELALCILNTRRKIKLPELKLWHDIALGVNDSIFLEVFFPTLPHEKMLQVFIPQPIIVLCGLKGNDFLALGDPHAVQYKRFFIY
jgi:hypothetical protein